MGSATVDHAIEQHHRACEQFVKGNPEPLKELFSHSDDVSLSNPFGPPVAGWKDVEAMMERAALKYRDGEAVGFDRVIKHETAELAFTVEVERYRAKVGGGDEMVPVALRVTAVFRPEAETWKIIHRHADPITTSRAAESVISK